MVLPSKQPIVRLSARKANVTQSSPEAECISADTGTKALTWLASLAQKMRMTVVKRPATLRIDDKPTTKEQDENIVADAKDLLTDNKEAFYVA